MSDTTAPQKRKAEDAPTLEQAEKKTKGDEEVTGEQVKGSGDFNDEDLREIDQSNIIPGGRSTRSTRTKVDYSKLAGNDESEEDEEDEDVQDQPIPDEEEGDEPEEVEGELDAADGEEDAAADEEPTAAEVAKEPTDV